MKKLFYFTVGASFIALGSMIIASPSNEAITHALGWVHDPAHPSACQGYYREPDLETTTLGLINANDSEISADSVSLAAKGRSILSGHIVLKQPYRRAEADKAIIYRDPKTEKIQEITLIGHVIVREPGRMIRADRAHYRLNNNQGEIHQIIYRMSRLKAQEKQLPDNSTSAWGYARLAEEPSENIFILHDSTYATCPIDKLDWQLHAKKITIDKDAGRAKAEGLSLDWKHHRLFTIPHFSFSIDDQRKTGFLIPTLSFQGNSGVGVSIPFYLNIAPNTDYTFTPRFLQKRGVLWQGEWRYLSLYHQTLLETEFLPSDRLYNQFRTDHPQLNDLNETRYSIKLLSDLNINPEWSGQVNVAGVSDDYYLQDLNTNLYTTTDRQLLQQGSLFYNAEHIYLQGRLQRFQTLNPMDQVIVAHAYSEMPRGLMELYYPNIYKNFDFYSEQEFVNFMWPSPELEKQNGTRFRIAPTWQYPIRNAYAYLVPSFTLDMTHYRLTHAGFPETIDARSRVIPLTHVDAGLYFDRIDEKHHHAFLQTLEPRLYYLYVPYQNQNQIPLFDTSFYTFNFQQLFRDNRFSGYDRIGDANQLSAGLTTRWLDLESGEERLSASAGAALFFQNRKLLLCQGIDCNPIVDPLDNNNTAMGTRLSPLVTELSYRLNPLWSLISDSAWEWRAKSLNNAGILFHYQDTQSHILNMGYQYQRRVQNFYDLNAFSGKESQQVGASTAWSLNKSWQLLGTWSYNLTDNHPQSFYFGAQYDSCCWAWRGLIGKNLTAVKENFSADLNTAVYLQFVLKGLGAIGNNNPNALLNSQIPGFNDQFTHA